MHTSPGRAGAGVHRAWTTQCQPPAAAPTPRQEEAVPVARPLSAAQGTSRHSCLSGRRVQPAGPHGSGSPAKAHQRRARSQSKDRMKRELFQSSVPLGSLREGRPCVPHTLCPEKHWQNGPGHRGAVAPSPVPPGSLWEGRHWQNGPGHRGAVAPSSVPWEAYGKGGICRMGLATGGRGGGPQHELRLHAGLHRRPEQGATSSLPQEPSSSPRTPLGPCSLDGLPNV